MGHSRLKHLGARRGEIGRHTLKLGSVIIRLEHVAAIMMAEDTFCPNENDTLRNARKFCPPIIFIGASLTVIGGVMWALSYAEIYENAQKQLFIQLTIGGIILAAIVHGLKHLLDLYGRRTEGFFRLMVETSGGTRFALVDHEVKRLSGVRELLYRKLETNDPNMQMAFDFDTEKMDVYT